MTYRKLGLLSALVAVIVAVFVSATGASASSQPQQIQDAQMQVLTTTFGGASVLPTTRTVQHWWGSTLDPHNGITYGYNMVGADPNTCAGSACSATVTGDIIPLNVVVGDRTFDGQAVVGPTLDSPIFATSDVLNFIGTNPLNCCVIGFHGAGPVPSHTSNGGMNGNGNQPVQTWAWASWTSPGLYARPNGGTDWALQDIHALSHEISEWADDPFINNFVEPWLTPTAPQYGCSGILETGDPVVAIGFAMGTNTTDQTANPWTNPTNHNPSVSYDGTYHPEDEV